MIISYFVGCIWFYKCSSSLSSHIDSTGIIIYGEPSEINWVSYNELENETTTY